MSARVLIMTGCAVVAFPYSAYVVERLKTEIPAPCREYDPTRKLWTIHAPYIAPAVAIVRAAYPDVQIESVGGAHVSEPAAIDPDYRVLHLLPTAPPELVETAYKCLARLHHPDTGGSTEAMQRLNAAVAVIRERVSA